MEDPTTGPANSPRRQGEGDKHAASQRLFKPSPVGAGSSQPSRPSASPDYSESPAASAPTGGSRQQNQGAPFIGTGTPEE